MGVGGLGVGVGGGGVGVAGMGVAVLVRVGIKDVVGVGASTTPETAVSLSPPLATTTAIAASSPSSQTVPTAGPFHHQDSAQKRSQSWRSFSTNIGIWRPASYAAAAAIVRLGRAGANWLTYISPPGSTQVFPSPPTVARSRAT